MKIIIMMIIMIIKIINNNNSADAYRDLNLPKLVEQNVGRLEVIVDDAASWPIQVGQPIEDLTGDCPSLFLRQHL